MSSELSRFYQRGKTGYSSDSLNSLNSEVSAACGSSSLIIRLPLIKPVPLLNPVILRASIGGKGGLKLLPPTRSLLSRVEKLEDDFESLTTAVNSLAEASMRKRSPGIAFTTADTPTLEKEEKQLKRQRKRPPELDLAENEVPNLKPSPKSIAISPSFARLNASKSSATASLKRTVSNSRDDDVINYGSLDEFFSSYTPTESSTWARLAEMCMSVIDPGSNQSKMTKYLQSNGLEGFRAFIALNDDCYFDVKIETYIQDEKEDISIYTEGFAASFLSEDPQNRMRYIKVWVGNDDEKGGYHQHDSKAFLIIRVQEDGIVELVHLEKQENLSGNFLYGIADKFKDMIKPFRYYTHDESKIELHSPYDKNKQKLFLRNSLPFAKSSTWYGTKGMEVESFDFREIKCRKEAFSQDRELYKQAFEHLRSTPVSVTESFLDRFILKGRERKNKRDHLFSLRPLCEKHQLDFSTATLNDLGKACYAALRNATSDNKVQSEKDYYQFFISSFSEIHSEIYIGIKEQEADVFSSSLSEEERLYFLALDIVNNTFLFVEDKKDNITGFSSSSTSSSSSETSSLNSFRTSVSSLERAFQAKNYTNATVLPSFRGKKPSNIRRQKELRKNLDAITTRSLFRGAKEVKRKSPLKSSKASVSSSEPVACFAAELLALNCFNRGDALVSDSVDNWPTLSASTA
ncbi:hypothetical protein AB751O23_AJ_00040 [Chlamydiales bacterium SCGC AB-751-O23]|nr:hypothetical protein AB751O23_AJ_00040 [Chlamydiales bacterium SCGC AB-751-O23]